MAKDKEAKGLSSDKKAEKGAAPKASKASKSSKQKPVKNSTGIFGKIGGYLKGVVQELKRVTWPTPKEMLNSGIIVIVTLIFFALFTFAFDSAATRGVTALANTTASKEASSTPSTETTSAASTEATVNANTTPAPSTTATETGK
ncbi:MAG: preprotein translocase subunit SecE [Coriobacteriia bacterium]|nr:preprotein translocase subunit SecE [Coriobacteriia bacterium]